MTAPFGARLAAAMGAHGPLCVGIDPHTSLLDAWGLPDDASGLRRFALTVLEAVAGHVAAVKPQAAFFERHGSAGVAVLEEVVAAGRETSRARNSFTSFPVSIASGQARPQVPSAAQVSSPS